MTDFPNGVGVAAAPNWASPLLDFTQIGNLPSDYRKGQAEQLEIKSKTAFRNGIPKTPEGQNDYRGMTEKMIEFGDYDSAGKLSTIGVNQARLDAANNDPVWGNGGNRPAAPAPSATTAAPARAASTGAPAVDPPDARPNNNGGFSPPPAASAPTPNTRVADSFSEAGAGPTPKLAPSAQRALQSKLDAMPMAERRNYLNRQAASEFVSPSVNKWALQELERLNKAEEQTQTEKDFNKNRGGAGFTKITAETEGKNNEKTPGYKDTQPGPGGKSVKQTEADIELDKANRTLTPTAKDTAPLPGESPAQAAERIKTKGAIETKAGEGSVANFEKEYHGLQVASQTAHNLVEKAKLAKELTLKPGFYSGPFQPTSQLFQQVKSVVGGDPGTAMPQEVFNKVGKDMLTENIKALGQSGVGQVRVAEIKIMQEAVSNTGITGASNRALLDITQRVSSHVIELSRIAREIAASSLPPQQKGVALHNAADKYYKEHPLFTEEERADPRIIGAPDAPPQIKTTEQARAWARGVGVPPGYPVRRNGLIVAVP